MGSAKEEWMRGVELELMYDWIENNFGDDAGEEDSDEWSKAAEAWEEHCEEVRAFEEKEHRREELDWYLYSHSRSHIGRFEVQMISVEELLENKTSCDEVQFSLLVMLHSHIVASLESYLSSTFVYVVTNSNTLIRKLVETDPEFSKRQITLKDIFAEQEGLKVTISTYLKDLIFHKIKKVKPMFKSVLGCDFGDVAWLYKAVNIRHHCAHRAGFDKDGGKIDISEESIRQLVLRSKELVDQVENCVISETHI